MSLLKSPEWYAKLQLSPFQSSKIPAFLFVALPSGIVYSIGEPFQSCMSTKVKTYFSSVDRSFSSI